MANFEILDDYFQYREKRNDDQFITNDPGCTREPIDKAIMPEDENENRSGVFRGT
jgi:hypothetical protein